jgi:hypothetical protein
MHVLQHLYGPPPQKLWSKNRRVPPADGMHDVRQQSPPWDWYWYNGTAWRLGLRIMWFCCRWQHVESRQHSCAMMRQITGPSWGRGRGGFRGTERVTILYHHMIEVGGYCVPRILRNVFVHNILDIYTYDHSAHETSAEEDACCKQANKQTGLFTSAARRRDHSILGCLNEHYSYSHCRPQMPLTRPPGNDCEPQASIYSKEARSCSHSPSAATATTRYKYTGVVSGPEIASPPGALLRQSLRQCRDRLTPRMTVLSAQRAYDGVYNDSGNIWS